jgi:hypothetical protein
MELFKTSVLRSNDLRGLDFRLPPFQLTLPNLLPVNGALLATVSKTFNH